MLKFNKIWLTKRGLWRCNVYYWNDLYEELRDIEFMWIVQKLKQIEYQWEKLSFKWFDNT